MNNRVDLHPLLNRETCVLEFRLPVGDWFVRVDVRPEVLHHRLGCVITSADDMLTTYEQHRAEIDAAVRRRAMDAGYGVVEVRPSDIG